MRAVLFHDYGGPEKLRCEEVSDPIPSADEALLRVEACALNHFDLDLRAGVSRVPLDLPHILGLEVVGRIERLPSDSSIDGFEVGQRVMVAYEQTCGRCEYCRRNEANLCPQTRMFGVNRPGGYAELTTARVVDLIPLDEELGASEWAGVQIAFGTAWHLVMTRGELRAGESVLVNSAGSGVSSAAIQIAKLAGAWIIATAGNDAKLELALELGADEAINYEEESVYERTMRMTDGRGVDLAVEHVGGDLFGESFRSVRDGGRIVTCGGHAGEVVPLDLIELFRSEKRIFGSRTWTRAELLQVMSLIQMRKLHAVIDSTFTLDHAEDAHVRLAERANFGKLILVTDE